MLMRLRHGRRAQFYVKFGACLLIAVFYFAILIRESLNAFEQNKEKAAVAALLLGSAGGIGGGGGSSQSDSNSNDRQTVKLKVNSKRLHKTQRKSAATATGALAALQAPAVLQQKAQNAALPLTTPPTASTVTQASTLNPVYEYSEEIHSATERDLDRRRSHLNSICTRYDLQARYPPNTWEFFISPGHSLVWCNVFKAASSTWLYYFNILGGYDIQYLQRTETQPLELARKRFPRPELNELRDSLPAALSFLFVRDPFERIVSAYRNKLEGGRNPFYKVLGHRIIQQLRRRNANGGATGANGGGSSGGSGGVSSASAAMVSAVKSGASVAGPTFNEFLHFLIEEHAHGKRFDEHWAPVYSFCTPCSVNFTIIGKLETFQRDTEFIIRQAGLESLLLGKLPRHKLRKIGNLAKGIKTDALVARYFAEIDRNTLDQLLNIYRLDFELFDYDYQKYYGLVQTTATAAAAAALSIATTVRADNASSNATKDQQQQQ